MAHAQAEHQGPIRRHMLCDGDVSVCILSLGGITQDWQVPIGGRRVGVVLGYSDPRAYLDNPYYLGAFTGRVANRISDAGFDLDRRHYRLEPNEPPHHLHGGAAGLHMRDWDMEGDGNRAVRLTHTSRDGEGGYPGNIEFTITVSLCGFTLTYDVKGMPDRPTPVNMAQHSYYNLVGMGPIHDHHLRVAADRYTPTGSDGIPTGLIAPLGGQAPDFRQARTLASADPGRRGIDVNYVLNDRDGPAVTMTAANGLRLELWTDQPGLQLYTGAHLSPGATPLPGQRHDPFCGVCLEPQHFPDSPNNPQFPSIIAAPERPYRQSMSVRIAPGVVI